jgi:hypothetical protein
MNLYWLVYRTPNGLAVYIQPAHSLIAARMKAAIANVAGEFAEGHQLDQKTERRVPKKMIGHPLTRAEAVKLLKRFE